MQPEDLIGKKIDNYVVLKHLARGGMADVYLAKNVRLQRDVALKILLPSYVEDKAFAERFQREAQAMAQLEHTNIVRIYDTGITHDGRPYIAMQYVAGGTLESLLAELEAQQRVMSAPLALAMARQVASALQAAHVAGVVHRDLKPSNVLLDEHGKPLLTDLGIAFVPSDQRLTRTDVFLGTPNYMSPEQGKGVPLDSRSDIYSLGVVLYEMLAGRRPFQGDTHYALIHQHVSELPPPLGKIRPNLSRTTLQVVDRSLEKDPVRRYQSAGEMVGALDKALVAEGAEATLSASGEWSWRPSQSVSLYVDRAGLLQTLTDFPKRTSRLGLVAALGAAALIVGGAIWLIGRVPTETTPPSTSVPETVLVVVSRMVTSEAIQPTSTLAGPAEAIEPTQVTVASDSGQATGMPSPTITASSTVPSQPSATPEIPSVRVLANMYTREGPGLAFAIAGTLARDEEVVVLGRDRGRNWYLVRAPDNTPVWVSATYVEAGPNVLEAVTLAATIPVMPTFTATPLPVVAPTTPPVTNGDSSATQPPPGPTDPGSTVAPGPTRTLIAPPTSVPTSVPTAYP